MLLEALARVKDCRPTLLVAGSGPRSKELKAYAARLGVAAHVRFLGMVSPAAMIDLFERADAFVFTSLQDSLGTVMLEAMARAVPLITVDHQGAAAHIPDRATIRIPVRDPEEAVASLAATIRRLTNTGEELRRLSAASLDVARTHLWPKRAEYMNALYEAYAGPKAARGGVSGW
jgi:glycosyltransferase involved in cell wall biosynthesis